ncbi:MAG: polyprenyl diphosphate synthase [Rothia sp. (in: high G+C Gram-positive bacteria)]|nr:polyprenyl diphosphate synthase [Rothia sp. (in: high G+C Gram-positive bacteria)]
MKLAQPLYTDYEKSLLGSIAPGRLPRHIGVLMDGNRRWAAQLGKSTKHGHQAGAERVADFLRWCKDLDIPMVTLYMLSTENLKRSAAELADLLEVIEGLVLALADSKVAKIYPVGQLWRLPASLAASFSQAATATSQVKQVQVNIAVGYDGRQEIVDAMRQLLLEAQKNGQTMADLMNNLKVEDIDQYLYTCGMPDPDLLIRTSGEQRLSGFLTWQSAYSEFYFSQVLWPDFSRVEFLRALQDYAKRQRRFGS